MDNSTSKAKMFHVCLDRHHKVLDSTKPRDLLGLRRESATRIQLGAIEYVESKNAR